MNSIGIVISNNGPAFNLVSDRYQYLQYAAKTQFTLSAFANVVYFETLDRKSDIYSEWDVENSILVL